MNADFKKKLMTSYAETRINFIRMICFGPVLLRRFGTEKNFKQGAEYFCVVRASVK